MGALVSRAREAILMLCFFHRHCGPVMATHDLAGRYDGGFQIGGSMDEARAERSAGSTAHEFGCQGVVMVGRPRSRIDTFF